MVNLQGGKDYKRGRYGNARWDGSLRRGYRSKNYREHRVTSLANRKVNPRSIIG